jgi:hypothetical protein
MRQLPLAIFTIWVIAAHIVLPATGRANVLPFFNWRLYDEIPIHERRRFDLVLERKGTPIYLTRAVDMETPSRVQYFHLAQSIGNSIENHQQPDWEVKQLTEKLGVAQIRLVAVVGIRGPLFHYLQLDEKDLGANVDVIRTF